MDGNFKENDISRVVEADRAHIWHHLSQHKAYMDDDAAKAGSEKGGLRQI